MDKSQGKSPRLFVKGGAQGAGRGPRKGAPNAGRPPDFLRKLKAEGAAEATAQIRTLLKDKKLDPDQLIKVAKEFDPADKQTHVDATLTVRFE